METTKVWKVIEELESSSGAACVAQLLNGEYRVSEWIQDIFSVNKDYTVDVYFPVKLVRVTVKDLGFEYPTTLGEIYAALEENKFEQVPPIIALNCRFLYDEQPSGEWLRFATPMDSMIDSDGVPHLPKIGKALGLYFIETYWAYEHAVFHPHNEFVVVSQL